MGYDRLVTPMGEMICHYGETLLCLKVPQRFSCETWQNKVFISLGYGYLRYIDLGFYSTTTHLSPLNMAAIVWYQQAKKSHDAF